ncbi:MAG: hypothetical protein Q4E15_06390 [Lactobacillus johnsonii]|nr:hypothetical protein [Lactobacillus johnsonii]
MKNKSISSKAFGEKFETSGFKFQVGTILDVFNDGKSDHHLVKNAKFGRNYALIEDEFSVLMYASSLQSLIYNLSRRFKHIEEAQS